eukprot:361731-Chlamydomonas_euryale.AAC.1
MQGEGVCGGCKERGNVWGMQGEGVWGGCKERECVGDARGGACGCGWDGVGVGGWVQRRYRTAKEVRGGHGTGARGEEGGGEGWEGQDRTRKGASSCAVVCASRPPAPRCSSPWPGQRRCPRPAAASATRALAWTQPRRHARPRGHAQQRAVRRSPLAPAPPRARLPRTAPPGGRTVAAAHRRHRCAQAATPAAPAAPPAACPQMPARALPPCASARAPASTPAGGAAARASRCTSCPATAGARPRAVAARTHAAAPACPGWAQTSWAARPETRGTGSTARSCRRRRRRLHRQALRAVAAATPIRLRSARRGTCQAARTAQRATSTTRHSLATACGTLGRRSRAAAVLPPPRRPPHWPRLRWQQAPRSARRWASPARRTTKSRRRAPRAKRSAPPPPARVAGPGCAAPQQTATPGCAPRWASSPACRLPWQSPQRVRTAAGRPPPPP